jgi:hypothetical protein
MREQVQDIYFLTALCSRVSSPDSIISGHFDGAEYPVFPGGDRMNLVPVADEIVLSNFSPDAPLKRFHDLLERVIKTFKFQSQERVFFINTKNFHRFFFLISQLIQLFLEEQLFLQVKHIHVKSFVLLFLFKLFSKISI